MGAVGGKTEFRNDLQDPNSLKGNREHEHLVAICDDVRLRQ